MTRSSRPRRSGITLLEVLISMFVLSVGLLGLMSLLPISAFHLQESSRYDRSSTLARAGLRDMIVRDYVNPLNWRDVSGFPIVSYRTFTIGGLTTTVPVLAQDTSTPGLPVPQSIYPPFVIDPLGVCHPSNVQLGFSPGWCPVSAAPGTTLFPPIIRRLTVDGLRPPQSGMGFNPPANDIRWVAAYAHAEQIFGSQDDRIFTLPEVGGRRPTAVTNWAWGPDGSWGVSGSDDNGNGITDDGSEAGWVGSDDTMHQNSAREYTYMATVSPELEPDINDTAGVSGAYWRPITSGSMNVSVVVFRNRDFILDPASQSNPRPEQMVLLELPPNDIVTTAKLRTYGAATELSAHRNEWIMVTAWVADLSMPPPNRRPILQWYKVVHVGDVVAGPSGPERLVTLEGSPLPITTVMIDGDTNTPTMTAYATIFAGAVAVFESSVQIGDLPAN